MSQTVSQDLEGLKIRLRREREEAYQNNLAKKQEKKSRKKKCKNENMSLVEENKTNGRNVNPKEVTVTTRQRKRKAVIVLEDAASENITTVPPKQKKVANNNMVNGKPIIQVKLVQKSEKLLKKSKKRSSTKSNKELDLIRKKAAERKQKQRLRIKLDPLAHDKAKEYDRKRKKKAKNEGKLQLIASRSRREQKNQRKIWRDSSRRYRNKQITEIESNTGDIEISASVLQITATKSTDRRKLRAKHARQVKQLKEQLNNSKALTEKWKKRCI